MKFIIFMLIFVITVFDDGIAKKISEFKCNETASLITDPRSKVPYLMEIQINTPNKNIINCSGTLICENFVLTSALCVVNQKLLPGDITIRKLKFPGDEYTNSEQFTVKRLIPHRKYNYLSLENQYDYALIQLNEKVPYRNTMSIYRPACLWTNLLAPIDTFLLFGHAYENSSRIPISNGFSTANIDSCLDFVEYQMGNRSANIDRSHMCFLVKQGKYFSNYGNPIVAKIDGQNYIFGIQSRTYANTTTRMVWGHKIYDVVEWIEANVWPNYTQFDCGEQKVRPKSNETFGQPTYDGEFPWHVAFYKNINFICNGIIINSYAVLTAAQCIYSSKTGDLFDYSIEITAGSRSLHSYSIHTKVYRIESITFHPNFNHSSDENNIAVLKTRRPIVFSNFIQPICLSKTLNFDTVIDGTVAGWGIKGRSNELQKTYFEIKDNIKCGDNMLNDYIYYAIYPIDATAYSGGSGSLMIIKHNSKWYLRGIASRKSDGCNITELILFTDVPKLYDWIMENA